MNYRGGDGFTDVLLLSVPLPSYERRKRMRMIFMRRTVPLPGLGITLALCPDSSSLDVCTPALSEELSAEPDI